MALIVHMRSTSIEQLKQGIPLALGTYWWPMALQDDWWLCRSVGCGNRIAKIHGFRDEISVFHWLAALRPDTSKILQMKSILSAESDSMDVCSIFDDTVLMGIARLLNAGKVHIHRRNDLVDSPQLPPASGSGAAAPAERLAPSSRKPLVRAEPFREPPADAPTFVADVDLQAQVATLVTAATSGKPFCPE